MKTGQAAEMPKRLKCARWPHFMEKRFAPKDRVYHSNKILGQLYDKVESVDFKPNYESPFDKRILRAYKLDDALLKKVRKIKTQYDNAMRRIMAQQEIQTEFEVWTTFVLTKPRVGSDYKLQEVMATISEAFKDRFRLVCIEEAGGKEFDVLAPFVAGMYKVTKEELDIALAECRTTKIVGGREVPKRKMEAKYMPLISFPWLFEKELGRIATGIDTSEELDALFPPLTFAGETGQRKRATGGKIMDVEDFIHLQDGKTIHRGEELDLFHVDADASDDEREDDAEEVRSVRDFRDHDSTMIGESGEVIVNTASKLISAPEHLWSGTGVEDVVPTPILDGLVNPRGSAQNAYNQQEANHSTKPTYGSSDSNLSSPLLDVTALSNSEPAKEESVEQEVFIDVKESNLDKIGHFLEKKLSKVNDKPNAVDGNSDSDRSGELIETAKAIETADVVEDEIVEEEELKESAMEKVARFLA